MKQAIPFEQAVYLFAQSYRDKHFKGIAGVFNADEEPDSWITLENGAHIPLDESGEALGGAGGWAEGKDFTKAENEEKLSGKPQIQKPTKDAITESMKPVNTDYNVSLDDGFMDFQRKNGGNRRRPSSLYKLFNETEENGGDGMLAVEDEFYKTRLALCTDDLKEISEDEAYDILADNMNPGTVQAWFREYNHEVKDKLVWQMTQSPEVHNAALNMMYQNYKYQCERDKTEPLGYDEFLVTPVKVYRGGSGKEFKEASVFSSYTFDRKVAEGFTGSNTSSNTEYDPNGVVYEAEIRPIDTYGSINTNGEMEILVPRPIAPNGNRDSAQDSKDIRRDGRSSPIPYDAKTLAFLFWIKQNSVIKGRATCSFS